VIPLLRGSATVIRHDGAAEKRSEPTVLPIQPREAHSGGPSLASDQSDRDATALKRFTLVIDHGAVTHVFYPVFPPDRSASDVIEWLSR
jgi:hypothetical protein